MGCVRDKPYDSCGACDDGVFQMVVNTPQLKVKRRADLPVMTCTAQRLAQSGISRRRGCDMETITQKGKTCHLLGAEEAVHLGGPRSTIIAFANGVHFESSHYEYLHDFDS